MNGKFETGDLDYSAGSKLHPRRFFSVNGKCHVRLDNVVAVGPIERQNNREAGLSIHLASCQVISLTGTPGEMQKDYDALVYALDQSW